MNSTRKRVSDRVAARPVLVLKGDVTLAEGTMAKCAAALKVKLETIYFYTTQAYARRLAKEIFDGDILEYVSPYGENLVPDVYVVEWHGHGFFAAWLRNGAPQYRGMDGLVDADKDMRVIGNIIQHQHLLRGNQTT